MSDENTEQVVIVGAGPAGLSAARLLVSIGARVLLIDSGERPGGQYWRHGANSSLPEKHDELRIIADPNVEYLPGTNVWTATYLNGISTLHLLIDRNRERMVKTRMLILATGAYDRSLPFPGWDTPGVMTAGGVQALLKGQSTLAGKEFVVAGTGPFLLPVAVGLITAGAKVNAIVEASTPTVWLTKLGGLTRTDGKIGDFATFQKIIMKSKVKMHHGSAVVAAHGADSLERVTVAKIDRQFKIKRGSQKQIACDVLAVGWGFTPDLSLAEALGARNRIEPRDGSLVVDVDIHQATSLPGVYAAGESTGIGGSGLALTEGRIAAIALARDFSLIDSVTSKELMVGLGEKRRKQQSFANALLDVYRVSNGWTTWLKPDTILCRCEETTVGDIRESISGLAVSDARNAKLLTRAGMGLCQGRVCGRAVSELVADECGREVSLKELRGGAKRPVITPIPLGLLAEGNADL